MNLASDLINYLCRKLSAAFNQLTNLKSIKWFNRMYCNCNSDLIIDLRVRYLCYTFYSVFKCNHTCSETCSNETLPAACCCSGWLQRPHWGLLFITLWDVWLKSCSNSGTILLREISGREYLKSVRDKWQYSLLSFASVQFPPFPCWQDLRPHKGPMLEQSVAEGMHPMEGTHVGAAP